MPDREKLIKLLYEPFLQNKINELSDTGDIADHLISHGVTVREPKTILTLHGYNAEALVLVAEMLRKHLITEDELDNFFKDFTKMYEVIIREQKTIISEAMATFEWPSVGEVVEMMWNERNFGADMRGEEDDFCSYGERRTEK